MTICLVTDRRQLSPGARTAQDEVTALARWLEEAVKAGIDLIQIRERDLPPRVLRDLAASVRALSAGSTTRVVVNERADVAMASGCHGVHLRGDGPPVERVRELVARPGSHVARPGSHVARPGSQGRVSHFLIGRSVHAVEDARVHAAADYLFFGAVFPSGNKPGLGVDALRGVVSAFPGPVMAIGGVTVRRTAECAAAGAAGVAAIRLFLPPGRAEGALGPAEAVSRLRAAFDRAITRQRQVT